VWLLGAGTHDDSYSEDVYTVLKARHRVGQLLPSEDDYASLLPTYERFIDDCRTVGVGGVAAALASPGSVQRFAIGDTLELRCTAVDHDGIFELWFDFAWPPQVKGVLGGDNTWAMDAAALMTSGLDDVGDPAWEPPGAFPVPGVAGDQDRVLVVHYLPV
jgi:hypothetical protein